MTTASAARFALALAALVGCGGHAVPAAPRSTCTQAAVAITRGWTQTTGKPAASVERTVAELCRSARWRPTVVRCFALARDPAELRVCARRLTPEQRDQARVVQAELEGKPVPVPGERTADLPPACMQLRAVFARFAACDRLAMFRDDITPQIAIVLSRASSVGNDPALLVFVSNQCELLAGALQQATSSAGC